MMHFYPKCLLTICGLFLTLTTFAQEMTLEHLSTYATGIFDEGAAEIAAYDEASQRVFFVNANDATVDVLDISDPTNPTLINSLDLSAFGDGANSVDVKNGVVAVAVQADPKQDPGSVVFFDADGNFLNEVPAGALPDMLIFTADGNKVLVANEGEPNDDYDVDPEGSVTIIDISAGVNFAEAKHMTLEAFNDKKMSLKNKGVRIFGNDGMATVAQDLEPEYIALSADESLAYVSCQENNALIVVDVENGEALDVIALGVKDHSKGAPKLTEYRLNEIPWYDVFDLGTPVYDGAETVQLGGFSGLCYDPVSSTSNQLSFWAVPDRGPNESTVSGSAAGTSQNLRPFKLPNYQARLVKLNFIKSLNMFFIDANQIYLQQADGTPISGRGNIPGFDEVPVTRTDNTFYTNADYTVGGVDYHALDYDPFGGDFEGVIRTPDFHFWLCDEYRPGIYHFDANGVLVDRFVPEGTSLLGDTPQPTGYYGNETLPSVYSKRRANRGFEAIAYDSDEDLIYAFIQSPIETPDRATVRNNSDVIRMLGIDRQTGQPVKEFVYLLERNRDAGVALARVDKIGDAVYAGNGVFYILERDSSTPDDGNTGKKYIYRIDTHGATNILGTPLSMKETSSGPTDKTLEMMTADDLAAGGIRPVYKTKVLNLPSIGYLPSDKPEGLALLPNGDLVVLNDNDFGLAGAGVSDNSSMGFIEFQGNYGFDQTDKTDEIDIASRPSYGMYQPDAITSFVHDGKSYIITANEGDARDYDGYKEEDRVEDLVLDPAYFPNANALQQDETLGRLKTTYANGDIDEDGMHELIYSYGARSFSIWDEFGNLVFDSGDEFEQIVAQLDPENFNSTNDDNDSFKNRSDDKGVEPEAVTVAELNGERYAFIGLERMGGVMTFNISDPLAPYFVDFTNNRNFDVDAEDPATGDLGVEDIVFIDADASPTGEPLLVTSNEVSGTVSIFGLGSGSRPIGDRSDDIAQIESPIVKGVFPNPFSSQFQMTYDLENNGMVNIALFDALGREAAVLFNGEQEKGIQIVQNNNLENLPTGNYWLTISLDGSVISSNVISKK